MQLFLNASLGPVDDLGVVKEVSLPNQCSCFARHVLQFSTRAADGVFDQTYCPTLASLSAPL